MSIAKQQIKAWRSLTVLDKADLTRLEDVIDTAARWQGEAAKALVQIRDNRLYRDTHQSFERYGQDRWGYERSYLYGLCQWGDVLTNLSAIADTVPVRESHARPLYSFSPEKQRAIWKKVLQKKDLLTARSIESVARSLRKPLNRSGNSALPYYGSKASLSESIISEIPAHRCFVETHAGGAAVLLAKPKSEIEVLNDIDDALVTFYRVLRDRRAELLRLLKLTPYARAEWETCRCTCDDSSLSDVERARRYYVTICQSFGGTTTAFSRSHSKPHASYWKDRIDKLEGVAERFREVVIEHLDAMEVVRRYDSSETVFYVDPPYPMTVRSTTQEKYRFEMTTVQHEQLLDSLNDVRGKVLLSGYDNPIYAKVLRKWRVCWRQEMACAVGTSLSLDRRQIAQRVEVLWANW